MNAQEFSDQFDVLYNNVVSNQAPGLTEYEKSVFLTKAQGEVVKNYFTSNSKGNNIGQGYDDSAKRQADFSCLMLTGKCSPVTSGNNNSIIPVTIFNNAIINGVTFVTDDINATPVDISELPSGSYTVFENGVTIDNRNLIVNLPNGEDSGTLIIATQTLDNSALSNRIDNRSDIYQFPSNVFIVINETIKCTSGKDLQVIPLRYDEYVRLMSKPYKRPLKYQAWRLINTGKSNNIGSDKYAEIVVGPNDVVATDGYKIRYIRFPKPIIVGPLDDLTIDGYCYTGDTTGIATEGCELDPILHQDILQRAVELAKISWTATGQDNIQAVIQSGQRSE